MIERLLKRQVPGTTRGSYQLPVRGLDSPILVRTNSRARRLTLRVSRTQRGAILTVPAQTPAREARAFVHQHVAWLKSQLAQLPRAVPFAHGMAIPLRGTPHRLHFTEDLRRRGVVFVAEDAGATSPAVEDAGSSSSPVQPSLFGDEQVNFETPADIPSNPVALAADGCPVICVVGDNAHAPRRLTDWLKKQARMDIAACCGWHAENLGLTFRRISVRDQTTRWGSCSTTGTLSFSWRLILAPGFVLDYVAAHEVAHLKQMNHSKAFWRLVYETCARTEEARRWLKSNGATLHRYGMKD